MGSFVGNDQNTLCMILCRIWNKNAGKYATVLEALFNGLVMRADILDSFICKKI